MPNRILREGILSSEPVCSLSWAEEVFYRRLMSVVDDHGRYHAKPMLLRAALYPLQLDKVSDSDIGKWLAQVAEAGLVRVYPASDGKSYLEMQRFGQQTRSKSKYPAPSDGGCEQAVAVASRNTALAEHLLAIASNCSPSRIRSRTEEDSLRSSSLSPQSDDGQDDFALQADDERPKLDPWRLVDLYHQHCQTLPRVKDLSEQRRRLLRARWAQMARLKRYKVHDVDAGLEWWAAFWQSVNQSDWLSGRNGKWTGCGFDWLINQTNFTKVVEGNYRNDRGQA